MARATALVTGANRGIGLEFTRQLLRRGAHVAATHRPTSDAAALKQLLIEHPQQLALLELDVADSQTFDCFADRLRHALGEGRKLDLLVNNAGVLHSSERFGALEAARFEDSFRTNALGPLLLTQAVVDVLADGGKVVNMSSRLGSVTLTTRFGTPSYDVSKAALNMVTALLASTLSERGIIVVAFSPGWVRTDMGGVDAEVAPADTVAGMLAQIDGFTAVDNGRFLDWQGKLLPW